VSGFSPQFYLVGYAGSGNLAYSETWQNNVNVSQPGAYCYFRAGGTCPKSIDIRSDGLKASIYVSNPASGSPASRLYSPTLPPITFEVGDSCAPAVVCVEANRWITVTTR
jgi:hypothetical protein